MSRSVFVAGIGNIFQGDDAFGVEVIQHLTARELPADVRVADIGIRSIDLCFALLESYELTILVDATTRGCAPGTVYMIEIGPEDIPGSCDLAPTANSHSLNPVQVLALAKSMGARFGKILLVGCEPQITDCDATGHIGLSDAVTAAVEPAVETILQLIQEFKSEASHVLKKEEVCLHEPR